MLRRRGFSLMEITAAGILLVAMLAVCLQLFRATALQRRGLQARRIATQEAANVMERLCARSWEQLTPEAVGDAQLSQEAQQAIPGAELKVDVAQPGDDPNERRITVVVRWHAGPGQPDSSVRLVAWRYHVSEGH